MKDIELWQGDCLELMKEVSIWQKFQKMMN